jgi:hypothetical protein
VFQKYSVQGLTCNHVSCTGRHIQESQGARVQTHSSHDGVLNSHSGIRALPRDLKFINLTNITVMIIIVTVISILLLVTKYITGLGLRSGYGTALLVGRSRDRSPVVSLGIFSVASDNPMCPGSTQPLNP